VNAIAEYPDAKDADIEHSLKILDGLQARWAILLENLNDEEWGKIGFSQRGDLSIEEIARIYAQHGLNHLIQIQDVFDCMPA